MAIIKDNISDFQIKITPRHTNWWTFDFEFSYNDKPVINPEIVKSPVFSADEYTHEGIYCELLSFLEDVINCREDDKDFRWGAWDEEVEISVKSYMKNLEKGGMDGGFDFVVFIEQGFFKDGEHRYGNQNVGVRLSIDRDDVKRLYADLKAEMEKIRPVDLKE